MDSGNAGRNIAQLADFTSIALQSSKDIKNFKSEISSRFVDGLYAKVIKSTHQRLSFTNYQDVLVISGPDRQWIVYAIAAENEKDYVSHIIDDARVKLPAQATFRQYAGSAGFSFLYGDKKLETNVKENTNEDTKRETTASFTYPDGAGIVYEMELKQDSPLKSQDDYRMPINEFVRGIGGVVKFKEVTPLDVVNGSGYRFATDVTLNGNTMPGDFALFSQGKYIWMLAIIGDDQQPGARAARDLAFNSLRRD
jgi:hypothetical protein